MPTGLIATLVLATTCLGQTGAPVTLHLWQVPGKGHSNPITVARRDVFDAFSRRHPHIKVRVLTPLQIEGPARHGNKFMAVAGNVAPDVFYLTGNTIGDYQAQGFLIPLNSFLEDYANRHGGPYRGINAIDQTWEVCHDKGNILCVPYLEYFQTIYCRTDLFARAGLGERYPKDWDELYEFARRLTFDPIKEPGANPNAPPVFGLRLLTGTIAGWNFMPYVWSAGGEVVQSYYRHGDELVPVPAPPVNYSQLHVAVANQADYEAKYERTLADLRRRSLPTDYSMEDLTWRLVTNEPDAMEAIKFQRRLIHQPWLRNGDHEFDITPQMLKDRKAVDPITGDAFDLDDPDVSRRIYRGVGDAVARQSGRKVKRYDYAMWMGTIQEADVWGVKTLVPVPFPPRPGKPRAAFIAGQYLGINAAIVESSEPGRRDVEAIRRAAWQYIEFVTGAEAQRMKMKAFLEWGVEERVKPALLIESGYADILERIPPQRRKLWKDLRDAARIQPYCDGCRNVQRRELSDALEVMINDEPDPDTGAFGVDLQALMDRTCQRVNTLVLGGMPPEELQRRQRIGWFILIAMALLMAAAAFWTVKLAMRAPARGLEHEGTAGMAIGARRRLLAWVLLTPALATIVIWSYYPLAKGMVMAFQDYRILGGSSYVGLRNFIETVGAPSFWRYLLQTFQYMALLVGIGFCVPIFLALLLTEIPRGKVLYRVIYYLPAVTTGLVTLFLWKDLLYDPTPNGVLNRLIGSLNSWPLPVAAFAKLAILAGVLSILFGLLGQALKPANSVRQRSITAVLGIAGLILLINYFCGHTSSGGVGAALQVIWSPFDLPVQRFLRDPSLAMLWCVVPTIWAGAGPGCLIYLAALKGLPDEQYEAADIDGAGVWQKFWNVTVPNLKALIIINFVGAVIVGFKESSNIFVMTGGGPENATMTVGLEIWYNAFLYLNFGRATAMAWIMGFLLIGFTVHQLRILNRLEFRSTAVEAEVKGAGGG